MNNNSTVLIIGAGLGGLSTALRLAKQGYQVEIVEKHHQAGGRLNQFKQDGFTFDLGPSFFSMSYEFDELFQSVGEENPLKYRKLDPLYSVFFSNRDKPISIYTDLKLLAKEFDGIEDDFEVKIKKYLKGAKALFHDTEYKVIKKNFNSVIHYLSSLSTVPLKHLPKLSRTMWQELERHFDSEEAKVIFSLVAFFLGATPFNTPAVYSLLNYTELEHDGYWSVEGGMYTITEELIKLLDKYGVKIHYNVEIKEYQTKNKELTGFIDTTGKCWESDIFVANADAASFRGSIMKRKKYTKEKLDKMDWTLAPLTIYLGVKGKIDNLNHHNYFLRNNFKAYTEKIFKTSVIPDKPYYYVNVNSKSTAKCAPDGCENLFILCPVPDRRYKNEWQDSEEIANSILKDLSKRIDFDLHANMLTCKVMTPIDWESNFNLYQGSGLGLAHGMKQIGGFRPANKDEKYGNLFYVGASTIPGTGLPIVIISSKLTVQRINKDYGPSV